MAASELVAHCHDVYNRVRKMEKEGYVTSPKEYGQSLQKRSHKNNQKAVSLKARYRN